MNSNNNQSQLTTFNNKLKAKLETKNKYIY